MENRQLEATLNEKKITLDFEGIKQTKSEDPSDDFRVIYTAIFYDKETINVDNIQTIVNYEKPLYRHSIVKHGEETKDHINWKVNIKENDKKEQISIVVAEAKLNGHTEYYYYNFFSFTFGKADRKFEFWLIFFGMIGIILLTYLALAIYIVLTRGKEEKNVKLNNLSPGLLNNSERPTVVDDSGATT